MFLKRLDVIGFKSFAQRVTVDFVKGVTAVVGPNGSGKSNITDAIRWVLENNRRKSPAEEKWKTSFLQEVTQEKEST